MSPTETTWDGLPIAPDNPRGAGVVVRRETAAGLEFLMLHRHHNGPAYEGDWAWTSPSGARFPGEPVLIGAARELHEEAGLSGLELRPVDLSGSWAAFATVVPASAQVVIDPEHDRYEWVSQSAALARLAPASVTSLFTRGSTIALPDLTLRPLTRADLPTLVGWFATPHVAQWFPGPHNVATAERKYGPRIDGDHRVQVHVLYADETPIGFLQCYTVASEPTYADDTEHLVTDPNAVAIDYIIGAPNLVGAGLGPQAIWVYLRDVVLPAHPNATQIVASPKVANTRSIRALEKAGFVRTGNAEITQRDATTELEAVCVLDRARIFGF